MSFKRLHHSLVCRDDIFLAAAGDLYYKNGVLCRIGRCSAEIFRVDTIIGPVQTFCGADDMVDETGWTANIEMGIRASISQYIDRVQLLLRRARIEMKSYLVSKRRCQDKFVEGRAFDTSLTEGQIALPANVRCALGNTRILKSDVGRAAALTGDRDSAATALLQRAVLRTEEPIDPQTVLAAERAIVRESFGRSVARYRAALAAASVTVADARAILADRIARERVEERFRPPRPTAAQVSEFVATYAATRVRLVSVDPEAPWLGDAVRGFAVDSIAPAQVFGLPPGKRTLIDTSDGRFGVRPLGPSLPLYALDPARARDVATGVLGRFARQAVYDRWLSAREIRLLGSASCARDALPARGDVDLTAWLPFLD